MRDELTELAADRLGVSGAKLAEWVAQPVRASSAPDPARAPVAEPAPSPAPAPASRALADPAAPVERAFLVQCLALPQEGRAALAHLDLDLDLVTPVHRRAALLLREHAGEALHAPADDEELGRLLAELQVRAAHATASRAALEAERLRLELARVQRDLEVAKRGGEGDMVALVRRREELSAAVERELEETLAQTRSPAD